MRQNKIHGLTLADQDWIGPVIFKNIADQDWIGFKFCRSGLDSDWKISHSAHLWCFRFLFLSIYHLLILNIWRILNQFLVVWREKN